MYRKITMPTTILEKLLRSENREAVKNALYEMYQKLTPDLLPDCPLVDDEDDPKHFSFYIDITAAQAHLGRPDCEEYRKNVIMSAFLKAAKERRPEEDKKEEDEEVLEEEDEELEVLEEEEKEEEEEYEATGLPKGVKAVKAEGGTIKPIETLDELAKEITRTFKEDIPSPEISRVILVRKDGTIKEMSLEEASKYFKEVR